jgi:small subunit ribosomal protein S3
MGHKTHPLGFRLGITQQHRSSWYSKLNKYADLIKEDYEMRKVILGYLEDNSIKSTGITKILINRDHIYNSNQIDLEIQTARPGILVGKFGSGLDHMDKQLTKLLPTKNPLLHIVEIKRVWEHADLVADKLVSQLEDRIPFRRAMKAILQAVQEDSEAENEKIQGIKIQVAGRVNGAEIARTEWLREGRVPLQTLRADIDYSYKTAQTVYGILGIKIWLFKGTITTK